MEPINITGDGVVTMLGFPYVDREGPQDMGNLRVLRNEEGFLVSFWRPSVEELRHLALGYPVMLYIMGKVQPPVAIVVADGPIQVKT